MPDSNTWPSRWRQTSRPGDLQVSRVSKYECNYCATDRHELCVVFDKTGRQCNCYSATEERKARHTTHRTLHVVERIAEHLGITI